MFKKPKRTAVVVLALVFMIVVAGLLYAHLQATKSFSRLAQAMSDFTVPEGSVAYPQGYAEHGHGLDANCVPGADVRCPWLRRTWAIPKTAVQNGAKFTDSLLTNNHYRLTDPALEWCVTDEAYDDCTAFGTNQNRVEASITIDAPNTTAPDGSPFGEKWLLLTVDMEEE